MSYEKQTETIAKIDTGNSEIERLIPLRVWGKVRFKPVPRNSTLRQMAEDGAMEAVNICGDWYVKWPSDGFENMFLPKHGPSGLTKEQANKMIAASQNPRPDKN